LAVIALILLPLFVVGGALWAWKRLEGRRKRRSPLTTELLRPPGFSLSERIDDLRLRIAYQVEQLCRLPDPNQSAGKQVARMER
jgi:hypothetical protein